MTNLLIRRVNKDDRRFRSFKISILSFFIDIIVVNNGQWFSLDVKFETCLFFNLNQTRHITSQIKCIRSVSSPHGKSIQKMLAFVVADDDWKIFICDILTIRSHFDGWSKNLVNFLRLLFEGSVLRENWAFYDLDCLTFLLFQKLLGVSFEHFWVQRLISIETYIFYISLLLNFLFGLFLFHLNIFVIAIFCFTIFCANNFVSD